MFERTEKIVGGLARMGVTIFIGTVIMVAINRFFSKILEIIKGTLKFIFNIKLSERKIEDKKEKLFKEMTEYFKIYGRHCSNCKMYVPDLTNCTNCGYRLNNDRTEKMASPPPPAGVREIPDF